MCDEISNEDITDYDTVEDLLKSEDGVTKFQLSPVQTGITCILCGETNFESASALVLHRFDTHKYKCPDCDKEYRVIHLKLYILELRFSAEKNVRI